MSNASRAAPLVIENSGRWLGNDGSWSAFYVHIGTPPQHFHVLPSFNEQTIYVPVDEDCARFNITDCGGSRGVDIFLSRTSLGFQKNQSSTWKELGIYRLGIAGAYGVTGNTYYGYDTVGPGTSGSINAPTLEHHVVAAYATEAIWIGQLGLSMFALNISNNDQPHSFLSRLKEGGHIPSLSFGYQAGAPYRYTKVPGSLILGGYDRARRSNKTLLVPTTEDIRVGLQSVSATFSNNTVTSLLSRGALATITTDVSEIWLPPAICDIVASSLGLEYFEPADRYVLTDAAHTSLLDSTPSLSFKIGTSVSGGDTITIDIPYAAFDLRADWPIFGTPTNYFPLRRALNDSQIALGRVFLQEVYLSVDWERDLFNISQAIFASPPPAPDIVTIESTDKPSPFPVPGQPGPHNKLSAGAIAGIAIAVILFTALLATLSYLFWRRKQKAKRYTTDAGNLPLDEKKDAGDFAPETVDKPPGIEGTELELEAPVPRPRMEMYAPHGASEMHHVGNQKVGELGTGREERVLVEAESPQPIYELPSPGPMPGPYR